MGYDTGASQIMRVTRMAFLEDMSAGYPFD